MRESPLVSIIILTYRRPEALVRSLASARQQSYQNRQIIVVDNYPQDGTRDLIASHAPEVLLIELSENRGACGGRNAGIRAAKGDIIVTIYDDVIFEDSLEINKIVTAFALRPDVHVLAFQLCDERTGAVRVREWCHPQSLATHAEAEFETNYFIEGACGIRREVYETSGLYFEPLFYGCEGWDLGLRIIDRGFRILHTPNIRLRHLMSMSMELRTPDRPFYFWTRNYIWIAFKDYPFLAGLSFLAQKLAMMLYFSIRSRQITAYLRGLGDGCRRLPQIRQERTPIRSNTLNYVKQLDKSRPGLWMRFARHREAIQL